MHAQPPPPPPPAPVHMILLLGDGSRINTVAGHVDSPLVVASYHYSASTLFFDPPPPSVGGCHPPGGPGQKAPPGRGEPHCGAPYAPAGVVHGGGGYLPAANGHPLPPPPPPEEIPEVWRTGVLPSTLNDTLSAENKKKEIPEVWPAGCSEPCMTGHRAVAWSKRMRTGHTAYVTAGWSGPVLPRPPVGHPSAHHAAPRAPLLSACTGHWRRAPKGSEALKRSVATLGEAQKWQCLKDLKTQGCQHAQSTSNLCCTPE